MQLAYTVGKLFDVRHSCMLVKKLDLPTPVSFFLFTLVSPATEVMADFYFKGRCDQVPAIS